MKVVIMQVGSFVFLMGGVATFAYQMWAWWQHTQVKVKNTAFILFIAQPVGTKYKMFARNQKLPFHRFGKIAELHPLRRFARAVKGID